MAKRKSNRQAAQSSDPGGSPAYEGPAGQTRLEAVHVTTPDGAIRSIQVHTGVNVSTDPGLEEAVLRGALHRFEGGEELSIPFVYHDPDARRFALVLPPGLRHLELKERSRLLLALAEAPEYFVPPYVRDAPVVFSAEGLKAYLDAPAGGSERAELEARTLSLDALEKQAEGHTQAMAEMEAQLDARSTELDAQERDLAQRWEEVSRRVQALEAQETEGLAGAESDEAVEQVEDMSELEEVVPDSLPGAEADDVEEIDESDVEELNDDDLEEEDEPRTEVAQASSLLPVKPPQHFLDDHSVQLAVRVEEGVHLFVRVDADQGNPFNEDSDLLVQLADGIDPPVVVLTLVDDPGEPKVIRRLGMDPRSRSHRAVLEALRDSFEATVVVLNTMSGYEGTARLSAARRVNVAMVLKRVARGRAKGGADEQAIAAVLADPPPFAEEAHPLRSDERPEAASAATAVQALASLEQWSTPERLEYALHTLSVPRDDVDRATRRVLDDAVRLGAALPDTLLDRALAVGAAKDLAELVTRTCAGFQSTTDEPDCGGLDGDAVAANWRRLLDLADAADVTLDPEIQARAEAAAGDSGLGDLSDINMSDSTNRELVGLLGIARIRADAAEELCNRADPDTIEPLFKALRKMRAEDVERVAPALVAFGEVAGDEFIDALASSKSHVRHVSALALGHLKLRRSVVPLVHLLQNEPTEAWREVARVLGGFGTAALRATSRALKSPKGSEERLALALAHLANQGCERQVQQLSKQPKSKEAAAVAERALALRDEAGKQAASVVSGRGGGGAEPEDAVLGLSHRFLLQLSSGA